MTTTRDIIGIMDAVQARLAASRDITVSAPDGHAIRIRVGAGVPCHPVNDAGPWNSVQVGDADEPTQLHEVAFDLIDHGGLV